MTAGQAHFPVAITLAFWAARRNRSVGKFPVTLHCAYSGRPYHHQTTNTDAINHEPAIMLMNTGNMNAGKPCLGSWLAYVWAA